MAHSVINFYVCRWTSPLLLWSSVSSSITWGYDHQLLEVMDSLYLTLCLKLSQIIFVHDVVDRYEYLSFLGKLFLMFSFIWHIILYFDHYCLLNCISSQLMISWKPTFYTSISKQKLVHHLGSKNIYLFNSLMPIWSSPPLWSFSSEF